MGTAIYKSDILDWTPEQLAMETGLHSRAQLVEGADGFAGQCGGVDGSSSRSSLFSTLCLFIPAAT